MHYCFFISHQEVSRLDIVTPVPLPPLELRQLRLRVAVEVGL